MISMARRDFSLDTLLDLEYTDAGTLMTAFWKEVESVMREKGVWA